MFPSSPRTEASGKRGGHPSNRAPPTPDAPESIAVPADALEQPRNPSSTTSNDGGTAVQDNGHPAVPDNEAPELPPDTVDVASACLQHTKNILQAILCAGAPHGGRDVFCLVKNILEHYSVNTLDEDTECLVEVVPDKDERALLLVDVAGAVLVVGRRRRCW